MKKTIMSFFAICAFTVCLGQSYKVSSKINIPGDHGWDYLAVDEMNQHLFVSHGTEVNVIDLKTNKLITTILDTKGVHGIAIANDLNKAFISNGKDNSVSIINLTTFELIEKVVFANTP